MRTLHDKETAVLTYENGHEVSINISMDSGVALMRDILREL